MNEYNITINLNIRALSQEHADVIAKIAAVQAERSNLNIEEARCERCVQ